MVYYVAEAPFQLPAQRQRISAGEDDLLGIAELHGKLVGDALHRAGYERLAHITRDHVPAGKPEGPEQWSKWFYSERVGARRVNLHVRVAGRANQRYAVLFRDYLRANVEAAAAYGQIKMALAGYHAQDVEAYYAIKDPVCDIIMAGAEAWAAATGWAQGPSDQ